MRKVLKRLNSRNENVKGFCGGGATSSWSTTTTTVSDNTSDDYNPPPDPIDYMMNRPSAC